MSQLARDLLGQARRLALHDPRRPRAANLRRAISSAYYALFHHLLESGSTLLVGTQASDWPFVAFVARAFDHGAIKSACRSFTQTPPGVVSQLWANLGGGANVDMQFVAGAVIDLQEQRHEADYDLAQSFSRTEVLAVIQQAENAINAWERLRQNQRDLARLATLVMLLWKQIHSR